MQLAAEQRQSPNGNRAQLVANITEISNGECPIFCVTVIWSMLPERSKDNDHIQGTAGRTTEGLRAA